MLPSTVQVAIVCEKQLIRRTPNSKYERKVNSLY